MTIRFLSTVLIVIIFLFFIVYNGLFFLDKPHWDSEPTPPRVQIAGCIIQVIVSMKPAYGLSLYHQQLSLASFRIPSECIFVANRYDVPGTVGIPVRATQDKFNITYLDAIIQSAEKYSDAPFFLLINADIIVRDFGVFFDVVGSVEPPFLISGQRRTHVIPENIDLSANWREQLNWTGDYDSTVAQDYFLFSRGFFKEAYPFPLLWGRAGGDNHLIWLGKYKLGGRVYVATSCVDILHPKHESIRLDDEGVKYGEWNWGLAKCKDGDPCGPANSCVMGYKFASLQKLEDVCPFS